MDSESAAAVAAWGTFFSAVAGAAATLVGLHFVSLALVPDETPVAIALTLGFVGVTGFLRVTRSVRWARTDLDPDWHARHALLRFLAPALACVVCIWAAAEARQGNPDALSWIVAVVFLLTMSAASSSWDLLKAMGERGVVQQPAHSLAATSDRADRSR